MGERQLVLRIESHREAHVSVGLGHVAREHQVDNTGHVADEREVDNSVVGAGDQLDGDRYVLDPPRGAGSDNDLGRRLGVGR